MAVYNGERFLADSVESVLNQTMPELELIVVDDGSTDASPAILASYARRDARVKILRQDHAGVPAAANAAIRRASYDLIARVDSDDCMLPNRLERQMEFIQARPELQVACSNCFFINAAGKRIGSSSCRVDIDRGKRELRPALFLEIVQSTVLMRKEAFLRVGGYREDLAYAEDRDLWGRFTTGGFSIACQNEFLVDFRLHGGAMTMKRAALQQEICGHIDENVRRRLQGKPELSLREYRAARQCEPFLRRLRENARFFALHAFKRASRHYGEGQYWKCALSLAAAVSLNPAPILRRVANRVQHHEARA
jgi:hypothetical protein